MGIDYSPVVFYGLSFSYDQVAHLKERPDIKELAIGTGYMPNCWQRMGLDTISPYFDCIEAHGCYMIGKSLVNFSLEQWQNFDAAPENYRIKSICEEYGLPYTAPGIIYDIDVC
jgi:hypothetical protein